MSPPSYGANSSLLEALNQSWDADYISLACSDNMMRLYSRLTKEQQKGALVLHIFHKHVPHAPVRPLNQRLQSGDLTFRPHTWTFHAVLYTSGKVLDLDYTNLPQPESFTAYFETMWPREDLLKNYRFQIKPAALYSKFDTDGTMDAGLYPVMTFTELQTYLEESNLSPPPLSHRIIF